MLCGSNDLYKKCTDIFKFYHCCTFLKYYFPTETSRYCFKAILLSILYSHDIPKFCGQLVHLCTNLFC